MAIVAFLAACNKLSDGTTLAVIVFGVIMASALVVMDGFRIFGAPSFWGSILLLVGINIISQHDDLVGLPFWVLAVIFFAAYFGQDVAHFLTCEPTFQSSYTKGNPASIWIPKLCLHTFFLIPLVIDAAYELECGGFMFFFWWMMPKNLVVKGKFKSAKDLADLKTVENW